MNRAIIFLLPAVFLLLMSTTACKCSDTTDDKPCVDCCGDGRPRCNDGLCHDCCIDDDCLDDPAMADCSTEYIICNDDYECECVCYLEDEDCSRDPGACCIGLACDLFTNTCVPECTSDSDCSSRNDIPFNNALGCENGICVFSKCSKNGDCAGGMVCFGGNCVIIPDPSELKECVIRPTSAVTTEGTTATFAAIPYLKSGAIAPGYTFTWSSDDEGVAAVSGGVVTGGASTGITTITATIIGCETIFCTASVTNYGGAMEARVIVVDDIDFTPVVGANVTMGAEGPVATDEVGVAEFNVEISATNPRDITIVKNDYNYVTLLAATANDIIVPVGKLHHLDVSTDPPTYIAGGIRGKINFNMIRCEEPFKTCDTTIGLAGLSIPGNFFNLSLDSIIGGMVPTEVELGGKTEVIALPGGLSIHIPGSELKSPCATAAAPGNWVAWGLGGKVDLSDLIDKLGPVISGEGDIDVGRLLVGFMPLFQHFYTALVPNVEVDFVPMVRQGEEYAPNCTAFEQMEIPLNVSMDHTVTFHVPELPVGTYDCVILVGGIIIRGAGFVPLGINAGLDAATEDDVPNGAIEDPIVLHLADVAGRIPESQVVRVIIALALNLSAAEGEPSKMAAQVRFLDAFEGEYTAVPFMLPANATYYPVSRTLSVVQIPAGTDYSQITFSGEYETGWQVMGEWVPGDYVLPEAPPEGDRALKSAIYSIDLADGVTYQDLLEFNDTSLADLVKLVQAFSYSEVP